MRPSEELYQTLDSAYRYFNQALFEDQLPEIMFTVQRQKGVMGYFAPERWAEKGGRRCHEIAINPSYIAQSRLIEIMQTLVHEMVHCWQYSFGTPGRGHYHNKEWALKMIEIGLMPSDTGEPGGKIVGQFMSDYIIKDQKFHRACLSLFGEHGFELKWADRKALPRVFEPQIVSLSEANANGDKDEIHTVDHGLPKDFAESSVELLDENVVGEKLASPWLDKSAEDFFIETATPRKTRVRYICPGCSIKLYGKSNVNIRCEDCDEKFIQSES